MVMTYGRLIFCYIYVQNQNHTVPLYTDHIDGSPGAPLERLWALPYGPRWVLPLGPYGNSARALYGPSPWTFMRSSFGRSPSALMGPHEPSTEALTSPSPQFKELSGDLPMALSSNEKLPYTKGAEKGLGQKGLPDF